MVIDFGQALLGCNVLTFFDVHLEGTTNVV